MNLKINLLIFLKMYWIQEFMVLITRSYIMTLFLRLCLYRFYLCFSGLMLHFILPQKLQEINPWSIQYS